jgi:hypothetical protein
MTDMTDANNVLTSDDTNTSGKDDCTNVPVLIVTQDIEMMDTCQ